MRLRHEEKRGTTASARLSCGSCGSLRDENRRLKHAVADLTLDRRMLQEALRKKW